MHYKLIKSPDLNVCFSNQVKSNVYLYISQFASGGFTMPSILRLSIQIRKKSTLIGKDRHVSGGSSTSVHTGSVQG